MECQLISNGSSSAQLAMAPGLFWNCPPVAPWSSTLYTANNSACCAG